LSGEGTSDRESRSLFTGIATETILAAFTASVHASCVIGSSGGGDRSVRGSIGGHVTGKKTPLNQCSKIRRSDSKGVVKRLNPRPFRGPIGKSQRSESRNWKTVDDSEGHARISILDDEPGTHEARVLVIEVVSGRNRSDTSLVRERESSQADPRNITVLASMEIVSPNQN